MMRSSFNSTFKDSGGLEGPDGSVGEAGASVEGIESCEERRAQSTHK